MKKLTLLAAGAVGYVLGTRAGRERYEQIKSAASKVRNDPRVQQKTQEAASAVKEHAPMVKDKMAGAAAGAKDTVQEKASGGSNHGPAPVTGVDPQTTTPYPEA